MIKIKKLFPLITYIVISFCIVAYVFIKIWKIYVSEIFYNLLDKLDSMPNYLFVIIIFSIFIVIAIILEELERLSNKKIKNKIIK